MQFGQRVTVRDKILAPEFAKGIWNPSRRDYRDIIELYLYMSRKFIDNKFAMFKLQMWIMMDLTNESDAVVKCKKKLKEMEEQKEKGDLPEEQFEADSKGIRSEKITSELNIKALREIIDGIAWRYLNYNRPILYILADKQPNDITLFDEGFQKSIYEFADLFLTPGDLVLLNDISNFLRMGDLTVIKGDGTIEFVEVKSSRQRRGARISRQKKRMKETVEFFNTGIRDYDGKNLVIEDSNVKQKNYLKQLKDSVKRAKNKGQDAILIGNHLIIEVIDFSKAKDAKQTNKYLKSRHKADREKWADNKDFIFRTFFIERFEYARNYAPLPIYPFDDEVIADILMGKVWIKFLLNVHEVVRYLEKSGWELRRAFWDLSEEERRAVDTRDLELFTFRKESCNVPIPGPWLGKLCFEMLAPKAILDDMNALYDKGPADGNTMYLTNYVHDQKIWK